MIDRETAEQTLDGLLMCAIVLIEDAHPELVIAKAESGPDHLRRFVMIQQLGDKLVSIADAATAITDGADTRRDS
ncbi:hypothetical protein [Parasphingopyxis lamellibrachiae]|uniref:Uncharacterized protein n=1 Tax=Parasphingopyxis lamellibrachiae TaxID=680125 RepID=A0A3D9F6L9_9SPHN|nr:hypothetical protein [Parasphingopyxis lamellibrachiae]RED11017.1 hypothetical protein DFR46_2954 [Parasphingopyxis lamellibrachiae]